MVTGNRRSQSLCPPQALGVLPHPSALSGAASALVSNQTLETLDLGQNALGLSGVTVLLEALRDSSGPLRTLRLKMDAWNAKVQEVLREVKESNPGLTLDSAVGTKAPSCCQFFFSTP
ncbi:NACHT, LRR and PYD domains-containing protein 2-like [Marmota marmota marmota]|uniref:NACHT, LRR and PYD domains-containing protein 2-like n=1 Tax=Marmota marmota marmota TaxID=9994 RepID=UPI0020921340|nr:NACHT, LRR and PYD domains-containing protein 2-like [Marmota marmota marmota]